jgi:hypothetical protein
MGGKTRQIPDSDGIEYEADQVFLLASEFHLLRKIELTSFMNWDPRYGEIRITR